LVCPPEAGSPFGSFQFLGVGNFQLASENFQLALATGSFRGFVPGSWKSLRELPVPGKFR